MDKVKQENINSNKSLDSLVDSIKILTELTQKDIKYSYNTDNDTRTSKYGYDRFLGRTYS